ncbi:hypothetical protein BGZ61DRAFT_586895 [Ilyonectria robusta]|uniref:uncharacterized protein n=1 Tax=Ilyonectria robusta TaxID=1079257 RepID=UPI001E8D1E57|nr:uncharacterized protein BGZ61DRAFT_586895 [Ilyonectria robusta]KAH8722276.1 hypothetical protein BGZ61DRAFT_586895 [Ilyonectria robusta]
MSSTKRQLSLDGSEGSAAPSKTRKLETQKQGDGLQITVKLRSTSKAAKNAPRSVKPAEYYRQRANLLGCLDGDAADELESSTDENGDEGHGPLDADGICGEHKDELLGSDSDSVDSEVEHGESDEDDLGSDFDEFAEWVWLEQIDAFANVGTAQVALCDAKLIRRNRMRDDFSNEIEEPCEETAALGSDLFDRYGRLRREYYEHEIKKGTGIWDKELDEGDILLFGNIAVNPSWRRQGIAAKIVQAVLDETRRKSTQFFAFAQPSYAGPLDDVDEEEKARIEATIGEQFFRSLGFRRVGTSTWLAFADDSSHPSRSLAATQDIDTADIQKQQEVMSDDMEVIMTTLSDPSMTGDQWVREIEERFRVAMEAPTVLSTDRKGNTILHLAAMSRKTEAVDLIQSNLPHLASIRNMEGYTPAEALRSDMELRRTRFGMSDKFEGFGRSDVTCLAALTSTDILYPNESTDFDTGTTASATEEQLSKTSNTLRLKYGCTCGQCIGGFLSPRMLFALLCQAEINHDFLSDELDYSGPDWVSFNEDSLKHLSPSVRENLKTNKSMREGFANMYDCIARCLRENNLPNERNVLDLWRNKTSEWPPVTKTYLQRGGTVVAAATNIFERAMNQDEWAGDGEHMEVFEEEIKGLATCRNDHEFGFVAGMCGYKRISTVRYVDMLGREI